ncbi:MAG: hypothetical protein N2Z79_03510, partial [Candidatus Omnitrophica bacterium]|nr:hypothetical protein [Candidatus Omnitrophota bacterium]
IVGILGLIWFLYSVFKIICRDIIEKAPLQVYSRTGILASLISFLMHHQVDYFLNIHEFVGLFWVLIGLGVCSLNIEEGGIKR